MKRKKPGTNQCECGKSKMITNAMCFYCTDRSNGWKRVHRAAKPQKRVAVDVAKHRSTRIELRHDPLVSSYRWAMAVCRDL